MNQTNGPYDDLLDLPRHVSARHTPMARLDRAAQFAPFAALTGHGAAIKETARQTEARIELDEDAKGALNRQLQLLLQVLEQRPEVTVTYFRPDDRKTGGAYVSATGCVKKLDPYRQVLVFTDNTAIDLEQIYSIDGEIFQNRDSL